MKRHIHIIMVWLLPVLLGATSCNVKVTHGAGTDGTQSVSLELYRDGETDAQRQIGDIRLSIRDNSAKTSAAHRYANAEGLARERFLLGEGQYRFAGAVNMTEPYSVSDGTEPVASLSDLTVNPHEAFAYSADVTVGGSGHQLVRAAVRPFLAELTAELDGAETVSSVQFEFLNMAAGVNLMDVNDEGHGATVNGIAVGVRTPEFISTGNGTATTETMRVMPTVMNESSAAIRMTVTMKDGKKIKCSIEAPVMAQSGKYILKMKVSELREYMYVNPFRINGWTEGWTCDRAILNPEG